MEVKYAPIFYLGLKVHAFTYNPLQKNHEKLKPLKKHKEDHGKFSSYKEQQPWQPTWKQASLFKPVSTLTLEAPVSGLQCLGGHEESGQGTMRV